MFDFNHWAAWTSQTVAELRRQGLEASFTLTDESAASTNPAFFVDCDTVQNLGRIIVWADGSFDVSVLLNLAEEPHPMPGLPKQVDDQNYEAIFRQFVAAAESG